MTDYYDTALLFVYTYTLDLSFIWLSVTVRSSLHIRTCKRHNDFSPTNQSKEIVHIYIIQYIIIAKFNYIYKIVAVNALVFQRGLFELQKKRKERERKRKKMVKRPAVDNKMIIKRMRKKEN